MKNKYLLLLLGCFIGCTTEPDSENNNTFRIQVWAGEIDRQNSVVSVNIPSASEEKNYHLLDPEGQIISTQISGRDVTFLLPDLRAGDNITLELVPSMKSFDDKMSFRFLESAIELTHIKNKPILQYRTEPGNDNLENVDEIFYRGGYLHPLFTPKGHIITEQYTQGRPHQNGVWTGWYKTHWNGTSPNFWTPEEETGSVEVHSIDKIRSGPVYAELQTTHHFIEKVSGNLTSLLSDKWSLRTYAIPISEDRPAFLFDLEVKQSNITEHPFTLQEYIYGGVGFRGNEQWIGEGKMLLLTSEGEDREEAHMSRARWVLLSATVDGEMTNIAILGHPDNLRFPEPIFVNQQEPFFIFAPTQLGDLVLKPQESFTMKYRYIVMDGSPPSQEFIEKLWRDFAYPPEVIVNTP